jgi:hypothetical protein
VASRQCGARLVLATLLACTAASQVQSQGTVPERGLDALHGGMLVVWFVGAADPPKGVNPFAGLRTAAPMGYQEKTTGSLGQSASTFGQDAGAYGVDSNSATISTAQPAQGEDATSATPNGVGYKEQAAGSFGKNAGSYGTAAGNYGTDSSRLGQTAGSYGTSASNHGQDLASFGNSTSTLPNAGNPPAPVPARDPLMDQFQERLRKVFPELQAKFTYIKPEELKNRLTAARGTTAFPDMLLGTLPSAWGTSLQGEFGVAMLRPANFYQNGVTQNVPHGAQFALLAHAQHMQAARALALWLSEPYEACPGCVQAALSKSEQASAAVAISAVRRLLHGEVLGAEADPQMAANSSQGVQRMLTTTGNTNAGKVSLQVEVERASTNGSVAAVALRVVVSSNSVFGVGHPLVVLRASRDGRWRVLQVSLNLPQFEQENVRQTLMQSSPDSAAEQSSGVKGVALASPQDGARSTPAPDLVWDNGGGAGLQVVEWQTGQSGSWSDSRLYLVRDRNPRLQTQVRAEFADDAGRYRWRVWSVGARGEMKISPWRIFNIVK